MGARFLQRFTGYVVVLVGALLFYGIANGQGLALEPGEIPYNLAVELFGAVAVGFGLTYWTVVLRDGGELEHEEKLRQEIAELKGMVANCLDQLEQLNQGASGLKKE